MITRNCIRPPYHLRTCLRIYNTIGFDVICFNGYETEGKGPPFAGPVWYNSAAKGEGGKKTWSLHRMGGRKGALWPTR